MADGEVPGATWRGCAAPAFRHREREAVVRDRPRRVREAGWETVREIVDFENTLLLCYVRGPEGLIVELGERLDGAR